MDEKQAKTRLAKKVILWLLIAVYTYNLPNARVVYNFLVETVGQELTGRIPLVLVLFTGLLYLGGLLLARRSLKNLLYLVPGGIIAFVIITLEPNPNKHIHIPQYTLMAWLLFLVLSMDYKSADIFILIFLLTSMLGVVDELEQGIHPARFYGWSDMLVNSASALIGVFSILGLNSVLPMNFNWAGYFKKRIPLLGVLALGFTSAILMCVHLFRVQVAEQFRGIYPNWLLILNIAFLSLAIITAILLIREMKPKPSNSSEREDELMKTRRIAWLWSIPTLTVIFYMKLMLVYIATTGKPFI